MDMNRLRTEISTGLSSPRVRRMTRKLRKLRRQPSAFFYDLVAKRTGLEPRAARAGKNTYRTYGLRHIDLAHGHEPVGDAMLDAAEYLGQLGHPMQYPERKEDELFFIGYYPAAFDNPFQQILYSQGPQCGVMAFPLASLDDALNVRWPEHFVCHLHWVGGVLKHATTVAEARARLAEFVDQLDRMKKAGVRLAWTVHNILPHGACFPDVEVELRQVLVEHADAIHIMNEKTFEGSEVFFGLPRDKTFLCSHPGYGGAYPDYVGRDAARFSLGLGPTDNVFVFFGAIQEHKGLRELLIAFDEVANEGAASARLLVAGIPMDKDLVNEVETRYALHDNISLHLRRIPPEQVQYYLRAADYAVCPYKATLNSGVCAEA